MDKQRGILAKHTRDYTLYILELDRERGTVINESHKEDSTYKYYRKDFGFVRNKQNKIIIKIKRV